MLIEILFFHLFCENERKKERRNGKRKQLNIKTIFVECFVLYGTNYRNKKWIILTRKLN